MKKSFALRFTMFLFCAVFAAVLAVAGCGGGGDDSGTPPGGGINPPVDTSATTTLYPEYSTGCFARTQTTGCSSNNFRLGSTAEYKSSLKGDITGTAVGIHIWVHAVGTQFDAAIILKKGGQEKQLASWTGLTTTNETEYELIEKTAVIEEQETAAGDQIIFKMTSANSEEWVSLKFGCLDSYITIPNLNNNGLNCSITSTEPTSDCSAFAIVPYEATVNFGEQISFTVESGTPPYTWMIDTSIDSIVDENGTYTAGSEPTFDIVSVTDSEDCSDIATVTVEAAEEEEIVEE